MTSFAAAFALLVGPAADGMRYLSDAPKRTRELVKQLASTRFTVRESASRELVLFGPMAREALTEGMRDPDPEVSDRCRRLLPAALEWYVRLQLDKLQADPNMPLPDDLPGVARWHELVGKGKPSRDLFLEMTLHHREKLSVIASDHAKLNEIYKAFVQDVYNRIRTNVDGRMQGVTRPELSLFLFLGSDPIRKRADANARDYMPAYYFMNQTSLTSSLSGSDGNSVVLRKLFVSWLEQEQNVTLLRRAFTLAAQANLKEAAPVGIKLVTEKAQPPTSRATIMLALGRLGGRELVKDIEPFFEDKTVVSTVRFNTEEQTTVQVRDTALGTCLMLNKLNPKDFGFERANLNGGAAIITSYTYYGFTTEEKRAAAFKKWDEWWAANAKK